MKIGNGYYLCDNAEHVAKKSSDNQFSKLMSKQETSGRVNTHTPEQDENKQGKVEDKQQEKEAETTSEIVVKPDGTRVLVVTTSFAGNVTTMSMKISEPTDFPSEGKLSQDDNMSNAKSSDEGSFAAEV